MQRTQNQSRQPWSTWEKKRSEFKKQNYFDPYNSSWQLLLAVSCLFIRIALCITVAVALVRVDFFYYFGNMLFSICLTASAVALFRPDGPRNLEGQGFLPLSAAALPTGKKPRYQMNQSTIIMPCNNSGWCIAKQIARVCNIACPYCVHRAHGSIGQ